MQAARDNATGECVYAGQVVDFHERFVGRTKVDGSPAFSCLGCRAEVCAKGGRPPPLDGAVDGRRRPAGHFAHIGGRACAYAEASDAESPEHRALKRYVAGAIASCDGWKAAVEVAGKGWRADVLAESGFDLNAVTGRHPEAKREVVFEVQHTPEAAARTGERTERYLRAGCEVVWLFDYPTATQIGRHAAVVVDRKAEDAFEVTRGIWVPGLPARDDLAEFVQSVLLRRIRFEAVPAARPGVPRKAWVRVRDIPELRRRLRSQRTTELARARALAAELVTRKLTARGVPVTSRTNNDPGAAYATMLATGIGVIAVHPRPFRDAATLEPLRRCAAVIVACPQDIALFADAGLDPGTVYELSGFEPAAAFVQPSTPSAPTFPSPPSASRPAGRQSPPTELLPSLPPPAAATRSRGRRRVRWPRWLRRG